MCRAVASGWFEESFRSTQARQAKAWVDRKERWVGKTFSGMCEPPCRLVFDGRVVTVPPPIWSSGSTQKFTLRYEFEVRCVRKGG